MRIFVTGTAGFIGGHLARRLLADGHDVTGIDRRSMVDANPGLSTHVVDLLDQHALMEALSQARPDAVVHLAARTDLDETDDLNGYAPNVEGVENLIAAIRSTPSIRRAVFTSSQLVCRVGYIPRSEEDYQPNTRYGESKVRTEKIVRAAAGGGVEWCLVRPTTVWGPGMSTHYQRFFRLIAQGRYVHVGSRPLYKSFGYVGNIVHEYARLLAADGDAIAGRTFYLADYEPLALRDWANGIQLCLGAPAIRTIPEPIAHAAAALGDGLNRLGWPDFPFNSFRLHNVLTEYVFDLASTRSVCGALPFTMTEGIEATVRWLRQSGVIHTSRANATN